MDQNLNQIIEQALEGFKQFSSQDWEYRKSPEKWSRKQILGHLVDSAIKNLQRFTEIEFSQTPYQLIGYPQDKLVAVNNYHREPTKIIIDMWSAINMHISYIMSQQSTESLALEVDTPDAENADLEWLMRDYIEHLNHHLDQILN
jgi:hypothetical protein